MEFQVGDKVLLKVSPWKGLVRLWKRGNFSRRYIGPFETVAYKLKVPKELSTIHDMFHVSNLKKCLTNDSLVLSLEYIQINGRLHFVEEPIEILDQEIKRLRRS